MSNPNASQIASLVAQKRSLEDNLRLLKEQKSQKAESLASSIRNTSSKDHRNSLRNQRTNSNASYDYQIESVRHRIEVIAEQIKGLRGS